MQKVESYHINRHSDSPSPVEPSWSTLAASQVEVIKLNSLFQKSFVSLVRGS